jgi:hypothetical protein
VDHPSFGTPVIGRYLKPRDTESLYSLRHNINNLDAIKDIGRPRYAVMLSAGKLDSMVATIRPQNAEGARISTAPKKKPD